MSSIFPFMEDLQVALRDVRTVERGTIRLRTDDARREVVVEACLRQTRDWRIPVEDIQQVNGSFDQLVGKVLEDIEVGLAADRLLVPKLRVVERNFVEDSDDADDPDPDRVAWKNDRATVVWEGHELSQFKGKLGRVSTSDGPPMSKVVNALQERRGAKWTDLEPSSARVAPNTVRDPIVSDPLGVYDHVAGDGKQWAPLPDPNKYGWSSSATQRKRDRQSQAAANRAANYAEDPETVKRREEEERAKRQREIEAAARRRLEEISLAAGAVWDEGSVLMAAARDSWKAAARSEAETRDAQVEAELFGSAFDDLDVGEGWTEAEAAARKLLAYLEDRINEAQARRMGRGYESCYESDDLDATTKGEGIQEHVHSEEVFSDAPLWEDFDDIPESR